MSKYERLQHHLASLAFEVWTPSFAEIEAIVGFSLPASARIYPAWWANDPHHSHASAWLTNGWRTEALHLGSKRVTFRRTASRTYPLKSAKRPAIDLSPHPWDNVQAIERGLAFRWIPIGRVTFDGDGRLTFPEAPQSPALYRFRIRNGGEEAIYIGETENLARRFGFYRNPGPSQQTNVRVNAKFREALSLGAQIGVAAVLSDAWIEHNGTRVAADLSSKVVRCLLENAAILNGGEMAVESLNKAMAPRSSPAEAEGEAVRERGFPSSEARDRESGEDQLADLVGALDRAEKRPGYEFVSLKWFRDNALPHEGFSWAADEFARHDALREAIDRRWVLTSKIANPRPPHFPVTAIRLNRQMPEVNSVLGNRTGSLPDFRPVAIRGEPLSVTVLRDRR